MKALLRAAVAVCVLASLPLTAAADPLTYVQLKTMVAGMGYTPNDLSGEASKFEATLVTELFNIPIGFELSKSGRYIWCTANLGKSNVTGDRALDVLKRMGEIQPTTMWVSSNGNFMIGIAIDNRDVTAAHLKFVMDKLGADVGTTAPLWQAPTP